MYHIYHTDAVVLFYRNLGEADRMYTLYTRELGLIYAKAIGIRKLESKSRFALPLFAYARVSFVRGRDMWRLTTATPVENFPALSRDTASLRLVAKLARLVKRLCKGEGAEPRIMNDLVALLGYLARPVVTPEERRVAELTFALRLLHTLGYVGNETDFHSMLKDDATFGDLETLSEKTLLFEINRALRESQL